MSSPPSQARTAEKLSGISPSLLCALTKRVHSPRVKISCTLAACWALGGKDTLCSASRWISSAGKVCLSPGLGSGAAGVPPFPTQCLPAQVPGSRSAGLWLSTPQQGGGGPGRRDLGAQRGGGSGQGVSNMLYPPQHTPRRGSEGLRLSRWGGRLPAEGSISPPPPQPQRQNWQGAAGAAGATQRLRRWGGGGRLAHLLKSSAFSLGAGSRGNGEGLLAEQRGWICISEGGRKAGCREGTQWPQGLVRSL